MEEARKGDFPPANKVVRLILLFLEEVDSISVTRREFFFCSDFFFSRLDELGALKSSEAEMMRRIKGSIVSWGNRSTTGAKHWYRFWSSGRLSGSPCSDS